MSAEESFMDYKDSLERSCRSWKKSKTNWESSKKFVNILLLQSRSPKRGPPFPSPVYYSFAFHKSSLISKFEKVFEAIRKNERDYKEHWGDITLES
jgi:hypothetical protein